MQKSRAANEHGSREAWLRAATDELRPYFLKLGLAIPQAIRFSVGFTSQGKKAKVPGEAWLAGASDDKHCELIVRADFSSPADVLGILVHQLVHACLPPEVKHGKPFRDAALRLGLEGPMRQALPGAALRERLKAVADVLGPFPHARLNFDRVTLSGLQAADRPKKQTTRLLKAQCVEKGCGYTVRIVAYWIRKVGPPPCPAHGPMKTAMPEQDTANDDADSTTEAAE
jgi:hypothetical protein